MSRPYRYTDIETLVRQHDALQVRIYQNHATGFWVLMSGERRELRRLTHELDKRGITRGVLNGWRSRND